MNIALDYDDTYTRDPQMWDWFIRDARFRGHHVYCVTMRYAAEGTDVIQALSGKVDATFFTARKAKRDYMTKTGIWIDVWIDDSPNWVIEDAAA